MLTRKQVSFRLPELRLSSADAVHTLAETSLLVEYPPLESGFSEQTMWLAIIQNDVLGPRVCAMNFKNERRSQPLAY